MNAINVFKVSTKVNLGSFATQAAGCLHESMVVDMIERTITFDLVSVSCESPEVQDWVAKSIEEVKGDLFAGRAVRVN